MGNGKTIAKNTLMLYIRMILIMLVSLYTSRVILRVLGVEDFGIYNVVGGVVTMLSFLNTSFNVATQRFLNYHMGQGDYVGLVKVFSVSFWTFCIIGVITLFLAETLGLWFVHEKLTIPANRLNSAMIVYHLSVCTFLINILTVPYNAAIIAHEKMSIYAYVSIFEVIIRLLMVFSLQLFGTDKLVLYGILMFSISCFVFIVYASICNRLFVECKVHFIWDSNLFKKMFSFSGWMIFGTMTNLISTQGVNFLINIYFGPALNASRAIAVQVNSAIGAFENNFMTAVRPQIVKSFAQSKVQEMNKLVYSSSKLSFYLLSLIIIPIFFLIHYVLKLWLGNVPEYAVVFTQLVLLDLLINSLFSPIAFVSQASGQIKEYQFAISIGFLLIAFFTYILFKLGFPVYVTFILSIIIDLIGIFVRLIILKSTVNFPVKEYLKKVLFPISYVFVISFSLSYLTYYFNDNANFITILAFYILNVFVTLSVIMLIGLNSEEKLLLKHFCFSIKKKVLH